MKQCSQEQPASQALNFIFEQQKPTLATLSIIIPESFVNAMFKLVASDQKNILHTLGFNKGEVPIEYIEQNFMSGLIEHVKEFLFQYFVLPFLYKELRARKLLIAGEPRLNNIKVHYNADAIFDFKLSTFPNIAMHEWKYFPFKAPKRKNYKDLDRQVDLFIKEEREFHKASQDEDMVHQNDWVLLTIEPTDQQSEPLFAYEPLMLWLKMGDEDADEPLRSAFIERKNGEQFFTDNIGLQQFFGQQFETHYSFHITILDILHDSYFCFELFKKQFKIKTNKEMLQKLIEVFSYRNDLSLRRSMVEEALAVLLHKHRFVVPKHLILRQQERVLETLHDNPDYHVYRVQKDFNTRVTQLAEKQVKEALLIDQLAYNDNLILNNLDMKAYLNLTKRPRAQEFIYFDPPVTKINGKEIPICAEELRQTCMREKALNHAIHHLTRI